MAAEDCLVFLSNILYGQQKSFDMLIDDFLYLFSIHSLTSLPSEDYKKKKIKHKVQF